MYFIISYRVARYRAAALKTEQRFLSADTAGVSRKGSACADNPVTGDDQRDRVAADGPAHGAGGGAQPGGQPGVGHGLPVGDAKQPLPHGPLERGALRREPGQEGGAFPREV